MNGERYRAHCMLLCCSAIHVQEAHSHSSSQSTGIRQQQPPNHHFYCILLPASAITALKFLYGKCSSLFVVDSDVGIAWIMCVCVCASAKVERENGSERTMEIILCTCARVHFHRSLARTEHQMKNGKIDWFLLLSCSSSHTAYALNIDVEHENYYYRSREGRNV